MIGWRGWYVVECDGVAVVFVVDVVLVLVILMMIRVMGKLSGAVAVEACTGCC